MKKENVYLVSGRQSNTAGDPRGAVVNHVLCCVDEESLRSFVNKELPGFLILSAVSLSTLEVSVKRVKNALAGTDSSWSVFVEPGLQA